MLRISPPPSLNSSKSSSIDQSDNPFRPNRYATLTYSHSFSYSSYLSSSANYLRSNTATTPISFHSPKTSSFNSFKDSFIRPVQQQQQQQQRQQQSQQIKNTSTSISNSTSTQSISSNSSSSPRRFDPKSIQKIVLEWCQAQTKNYPNVKITNFSSSWADGLAFCALIHSFLPNSFDYSKLSSENRHQNFELAFETAYKEANITPLLEVNDMLLMGNRPDDRCIYTYVATIYSRFQSRPRNSIKYPI